MTEETREEINTLRVVKKLLYGITSLNGKPTSVKCVVDNDQTFELTSNALKYLKAIDCKHWAYDIIHDRCISFDQKFGFGIEELFLFVGVWCDCFLRLLNIGIPSNVITYTILEIVDNCCDNVFEKYSVKLTSIDDVLSMGYQKTKTSETFINPSCNASKEKNISKLSVISKSPKLGTSLFATPVSSASKYSTETRKVPFAVSTVKASPYGKPLNFSRYSRHAMMDREETQKSDNEKKIKRSVSTFCSLVCGNLDENILETVTDIYLYEASSYMLNDDDLNFISQLHVDPDRVILNTYIGAIGCSLTSVNDKIMRTSAPICVCRGISLECSEWFIFDILKKFHNQAVNIVLINTNVYGNTLPDSKVLDIKEISERFDATQIGNPPSDSVPIVKSMKDLNISIILYRGVIDDILVSEFASNDIAVVSVKDFTLMYKLSIMLSSKIVFGIPNVKRSDVRYAKLHIFEQLDYIRITKPRRRYKYGESSNSFLYFIIAHVMDSRPAVPEEHSGNQSLHYQQITNRRRLFYSVFFVARSVELNNLLEEMFWDGFNRVQVALKSDSLIQAYCYSEEKLVQGIPVYAEYFKADKNNETLCVKNHVNNPYSIVPWIEVDIGLYIDTISKEIINLLDGVCKHYACSGVKYESCNYRKAVWTDSLHCVVDFINTKMFNMTF